MTEWCQQIVYAKMKCFCCNKGPNWAGKENSLNKKYDTNCTMWYVGGQGFNLRNVRNQWNVCSTIAVVCVS